jgi:NAD(P)-dependent dehydrogenase (short-subunit alcohol dehydrogenase family)
MEGKHAVISGGAKGIGESAVRIFVRDGYKVSIMDIDLEAGNALSDDLGKNAHFIKCDMGDESNIKSAFEEAKAHFGEIDVLVNNVGINVYGTILSTTSEEWDRTMNVNLKSYFLCSKEAIPSMQKQGAGVIINISSVQAFVSQGNVAAYTTAKTALLGFTRSIAVDYSPEIRSVVICPGTIDTPMLHKAINESPDPQAVLEECNNMHLLKRIGKPDEVGELIAFAASEKGGFMTGQAIRVDGGLGIEAAGSKKAEV